MQNYADSDSKETATKDNRGRMYELYKKITDPCRPLDSCSVQKRTAHNKAIEKLLKTEFLTSRDLRRCVEEYLRNFKTRKGTASERLSRARKKKKWIQKELAARLGYKSHVPISYFEKGLRHPPERIFNWLKEQGM